MSKKLDIVEFECHCCDAKATAKRSTFEIPLGWGFVGDHDPYTSTGWGSYYACPDCKETDQENKACLLIIQKSLKTNLKLELVVSFLIDSVNSPEGYWHGHVTEMGDDGRAKEAVN